MSISNRFVWVAFAAILVCATEIGFTQDLSWTRVTERAPWQPRDSQGEVVFGDRLWIFGGWFNSMEAPPRDVWSSTDGKAWTLVEKSAPWLHSDLPMSIAFKGRMWMMGGWYNGRLPGHSASNQVWSSTDGEKWEQVTPAAGWTPRIAAAVVEFKERMYVLGGTENYYFGDAKSLKNDVWYSTDGKQWIQATAAAPWSPRAYHQAAVLNGKIYVFGGGNYVPEYQTYNDVWCSEDGIHWTQVTSAAPWHPRLWFSSAVYRDHMWVLGGWSNNPSKNWGDAWYSKNGKEWKQLAAPGAWKERHEHSAYVFQDKLWIAGGHAQPLSSEVWSLQLPVGWSGNAAIETPAREGNQTERSAPEPIAHWPLQTDARDHSESKLSSVANAIQFSAADKQGDARTAAIFDGKKSVVEVADAPSTRLGTGEFSISLWAHTDTELEDLLGDLVSQYDPATRTGFNLGIYNHGGVTNSQPNSRQLHFGIDQGRLEDKFADHGQLGNAVFVFSLCVHDGRLYAATCHAGAAEVGHVYRFEGGDRWTDLGSPDTANAISAMAVYNGNLYVASSKYRLAGSSLSESENPNFGGKVFRLADGDVWQSCGSVSPQTEGISALIVFRGKLYASSLYRPAGFFRYEGDQRWTPCETPQGKRVEALTVHNGLIYATSYDEGSVFSFDGQSWQDVGKIPEATQTYGFGVYRGNLYVSEWPKAHVFRYDGGTSWTDTGKLGGELEAMPLLVYNGKMYGGTLPMAEVHRYDGDHHWTRLAQVDQTPDVKYRRAWSMAVYNGRLFVGTLPSGRVLSIEAGKNATYDRELVPGWHHIAAIRRADKLQLYVDGQRVAESTTFDPEQYNLSTTAPLRIGFGAQDYFNGKISDVRLFRSALSSEQVRELASGEQRIGKQ
ncbi:MAG: LamG-like jellyroll fold domain-containing protein [Pirellula sp.]